jgi:hypothetical protein
VPEFPDFQTIALRLLAIGLGLVAWFVTQRMIAARSVVNGAVYDHLHVVTARWNAWLNQNPKPANAILVASSLGVDALTLFVLAFAVLGPSFTPFWGLLALFALRQLSQASVALPAPPGIIWRHPGFPSLFVTYHVGNDFFFSGHTALAVYGAIQLASLQVPALTVLGITIAALEAIVVIVLRAHWTMDVLAGFFAALCVGLLAWPG